jgi:peptide chain release factor 1
MFQRLEDVEARIEELDAQLMNPAVHQNPGRLRDLMKERSHIAPIVDLWQRLRKCETELQEAKELRDDPDLGGEAAAEVTRLDALIAPLKKQLQESLLPPDKYEGRDIILEIRAGTGGDEAALFAADLYRMYMRYCSTRRWKTEVLDSSEIAVGGGAGKQALGYKEVICQISGAEAYRYLKYESGVHRVQRVPLTEASGRIHTSAATVAILPLADEVEVDINPNDLRIDVYRAGGPGGQSVNTTDSAVRITHIPTGIVVQCQDEKSQHKNKAKALKVLAARMLEQKQAEADALEAAARKAQVGSGDRSERIRTYNFPQNRVTDHRVGLTLYNLDRIIEGDLDDLVGQVGAHFQAEIVAGLGPAV